MSATLTVVVPVHNGAAFLAETLDSLAAQSEPLAEVIVVDDGSTDGSAEIAEGHRLGPRVIRQENRGVAVARNTGAFEATSSHVAFLDQDDLWAPVRHARLVRFLARHPEHSALVTTERTFYLSADRAELRARGEQLHRFADHPRVESVADLLSGAALAADDGTVPEVVRDVGIRELLGGTVTVTTSYVFERRAYFTAGGCAPFARSMDDYWALLNLCRLVGLVVVDEPSVLYRIHPASTTMSTAWPRHLLSSLVAARYGGVLVPVDRARDPKLVAPLLDERGFWIHQLDGLVRGGSVGDAVDAIALVRLLGCSRSEQLRVGARLLRTAVGGQLRQRIGSGGRRGSAPGAG